MDWVIGSTRFTTRPTSFDQNNNSNNKGLLIKLQNGYYHACWFECGANNKALPITNIFIWFKRNTSPNFCSDNQYPTSQAYWFFIAQPHLPLLRAHSIRNYLDVSKLPRSIFSLYKVSHQALTNIQRHWKTT